MNEPVAAEELAKRVKRLRDRLAKMNVPRHDPMPDSSEPVISELAWRLLCVAVWLPDGRIPLGDLSKLLGLGSAGELAEPLAELRRSGAVTAEFQHRADSTALAFGIMPAVEKLADRVRGMDAETVLAMAGIR